MRYEVTIVESNKTWIVTERPGWFRRLLRYEGKSTVVVVSSVYLPHDGAYSRYSLANTKIKETIADAEAKALMRSLPVAKTIKEKANG